MDNATCSMPSLFVEAYRSKKKYRKAIKKEMGCKAEIESDFQCMTFEDEEYCQVKNFILVKGFDGSDEMIAILAHEVSHAVDSLFERMREEKPGTETRAYMVQAAMMNCLAQLRKNR